MRRQGPCPVRPDSRPRRRPRGPAGWQHSRGVTRASKGGSRARRKVAVVRKAKNNPHAGSLAPSPHSGRAAAFLSRAGSARPHDPPVPRAGPGGRPGGVGEFAGESRGRSLRGWLGPDPSDFRRESGFLAPGRLLGLSFRSKLLRS